MPPQFCPDQPQIFMHAREKISKNVDGIAPVLKKSIEKILKKTLKKDTTPLDRFSLMLRVLCGRYVYGGIFMDDILEFFVCDSCSNKDFSPLYNFCLRFHGVNFSDELIYDEMIEERYQCTKCQKSFTKKEIEEGLSELRKKRKMD